MGSLCTVINSQLSPKGEDKTGGMLGMLPDGLDRPYTKNIMQEMPRTWENKREQWQHDPELTARLRRAGRPQRGKRQRETTNLFFSQGKLLQQLNLSGCCCQNGGNLSNLLSTPAASPPLLPSHLLVPCWYPVVLIRLRSPSSLSLPHQWTECGCRHSEECQSCRTQQKWHKSEPETGRRRRQQGFLALCHWDLPDSIKSPHAILNYLELLKL